MHSAAYALAPLLTRHPTGEPAAQVCTLTRHQVLRLGNLRHESAQCWQVRKTPRHALPDGGFAFALHTLAYQSPPAQGLARLAAELAAILATLEVETAPTGLLVRVVNKAQLQARWAERLPELRTRYRADPAVTPAALEQLGQVLAEGEELEGLLATWPEYQLLFPPLYGHVLSTTETRPGTAVLARFVGEVDLPLRTSMRLAGEALPTGAATSRIEVAGEVDPARYRAAEVGQALRALLDEPRLDASVLALHHEAYTLGSRHELLAARRHTRADIQGVVSQQLTLRLDTQAAPPSTDQP